MHEPERLDGISIRSATDADVTAIAELWHAGWPDGHLGNVPDGLLAYRRYEHFLALVPSRVDSTTVAVRDEVVIGFVTVHDDEIEQMYVDKAARGTGVAASLLAEGERVIAVRHPTAWLAVVAGNARARRFYERCGWRVTSEFEYSAEVSDGTVAVPALRYEKQVISDARSRHPAGVTDPAKPTNAPIATRVSRAEPEINAGPGRDPGLGVSSSLRSASMDGGQQARPTVYMHIGPPKTGTTYIQSTLRAWHKDLKLAGILFPGIPMLNHFTAALDARGNLGYGIHVGEETERTKAVGAWDRLLKKTLSFDGTVIVSHEVFASCDEEHARAAIRDLSGTDLHLVVTARDPARQIVSSWQQRVRQGSKTPLETVAKNVQKRRALSSGQDISALTERWAHALEPGHVHIVTVPPSGSDPTLLWRRFAEVVGIDADRFDTSRTQRSNEGRGWVEIELLRRLNVALDDRMPHVQFHRMVPRYYAGKILSSLPSSRKVLMPESLRPVADDIADRWIETIKQRGYDLVGDLEDLRPVSDATTVEEPSDAEIAGLAVAATAEMLLDDTEGERGRPHRRRQARAAKQGVSGFVRRGRRRLSRSRQARSSSRSRSVPDGG